MSELSGTSITLSKRMRKPHNKSMNETLMNPKKKQLFGLVDYKVPK
jgi:hypothetical protein